MRRPSASPFSGPPTIGSPRDREVSVSVVIGTSWGRDVLRRPTAPQSGMENRKRERNSKLDQTVATENIYRVCRGSGRDCMVAAAPSVRG